jgi:DNA-binding transcriptional ArsR family regulator
MDFSVLASRDCSVVFAAVVLCSDRGVDARKMGYGHGGIAHLTAKGAAGRTGLSQAASGRALRRLEEAGLIIGNGDGRCLADQRGHLRRGRRQRVTRTGARRR